MNSKIKISWDMETADPDDIFTLCLLATHPKVELVSVTVHPGSKHQIGVVKHVLSLLDLSNSGIMVGSAKPNHPKECVSQFHYNWLGNIPPQEPDGLGDFVLEQTWENPNYKIVTGAALTNVGNFLNKMPVTRGGAAGHARIEEIVVQGGFAGDSVVPSEYRLDKFKGKETCPTFNLNGNIEAAKQVIASNVFEIKRFVSKNVCHGIVYDQDMHERIKPFRHNNAGLNLIVEGMSKYLKNKPSGKAFHDPLAACVAISSDCCEFKEVEIYREKGEWGSRLKEGTNTFISIHCNRDRFEQVLIGK
jgi:inosine-uridine nucleoside N-ribohydrolase